MFLYEPDPIDASHIYQDGYVGINQYYIENDYIEDREVIGYEWYIEGTEDDPDKIEKTLSFRDTPLYYDNAWNFDLVSTELNWSSGYPTFEFQALNNHRSYHRYIDGVHDIYEEILNINILVNDQYDFEYSTEQLGYLGTENFLIDVPIDLTESDTSIKWSVTSEHSWDDKKEPFYDEGEIYISNSGERNYVVDIFDSSKEIKNIIKETPNEVFYENIKINPLTKFEKYPSEIEEIYEIEYSNDLNNFKPTIVMDDDLIIENMSGLNDINHKQKIENNVVNFDDYYYYDSDSEKTMKGHNPDYFSSKTFKIPMDYTNNLGEIESKFTLTSFGEYLFTVNSHIGNSKKLRGNNFSKFYFESKEMQEKPNEISFIIPDLSKGKITREELENIINEN